MKWIKRIFGGILIAIVVIVVSLFFLPADRIAQIAAEQIRTQTGRDVKITGDVSMTLWPVLGASVGGLEVGNAEWSRQGAMLTAKNAAVGIDALALLRGEISITNIEATSPTIRLESRKDGRASWQFSDASGEAVIETETAPSREAQAISIKRLEITDATLIYDAEGSDLVSYSGVDLELDWPERLGHADISATLRPAGQDVDVQARIDGFSGFIAGQVQGVSANIAAGGGTLSLNGRASTAGDVAGKLALNLPNTDNFLTAVGLNALDLPSALGASMALEADVTLTSDRRLSLRGMRVDLGGNAISGAADVSLNGVPQVNAQLSAGALDLTSATGGGSAGDGSSDAVNAGWSKARIDASGLAAFNGEIGLTATSIDLGTFKLGTTRTLIKNENSRIVFELREVQAYGGTVSGQFVMNNRNGLSVGGKIFANSISMKPLLGDAAGITRLNGAGDAEVSFLASGNSVQSIMNSMSGKGALKLGKGTIEGLDLNALMGNGKGSGGTTVFDSLVATFDMKDGNLRNDDLLFSLPNYEARGKGRVGLGAQDIDYVFTPTALRANSGQGLAIPVKVTGPWADPKIRPDLKAVIDLNFSKEKERIEQRAREKVEQKLKDELGVSAQDGQSLEDAAKDKVEDKLKRELLKIFD
ncbi:AsmA family protein [Ascidiaceihabitans sp.]|uniref:AsmA family protein n=1 Tax=Ascidiaceihabitans sp. TaxID=1872644 RepID=UPI003297D7F7